MRRAIEKLTFLFLSLAAASLLSFALLARLTDSGTAVRGALPLLVNAAPHDARDLTLAAVHEAAEPGPRGAQGRAELERLGGAAFPYVLPFLESLEPAARGRVALALAPVARRMGVASSEDLGSPERAVVFFTRFWQDRSADFRAAAVRRKVQRLAERALPLRRKEVIELDTFALGELFDALGRVRDGEDVKRVERLDPVLTHITGTTFSLPANPSLEEAAATATAWRDWAFDHGMDFATLDGPARLAATVLQTRYFRFIASVPRSVRGDDPSGSARLREVVARASTSVPLALLGLGLGVALSLFLASWLARRERFEHAATVAATFAAAVPLTGVATRGAGLGAAGIVAALAFGSTALLLLELESTERELGRLRRAVARAGTLLPVVLATELGAEAVLGRGLGALGLHALARHDLEALMWIAFVLSATGALGLLLPDALHHARFSNGLPAELVPGRRRHWVLALAGALLVAFALSALLAPAGTAPLALLVRAAGKTFITTAIVMATAGVVAFVLGLLAGGISRFADAFLSRALEVTCALPQPLVACAAFTFGGLLGPGLLGVLRGVEVGHVLRTRLTERRMVEAIEPPSLGRAPLSPYLKRVLPGALGPAGVSLALSTAWLATLEGAGACVLSPAAASLSSLAIRPGSLGLTALLGLALLTSALCFLVRELTPHAESDAGAAIVLPLRRRSTRPPGPAPGPDGTPP